MKRGPGPKRDTDKAREFADRRFRTPLPVKSARRQEQDAERAKVVAEVLRRAGAKSPADLSACQYRAIVPEVECGWLPDRRRLEVDELRGGSHRAIEWLNPDACRAVCPVHHDVKTDGITIAGRFIGKLEVLRRLALHEGRTP